MGVCQVMDVIELVTYEVARQKVMRPFGNAAHQ